MNSLELKAHAKINLSLDVLSRREDGYHELRMIMQGIQLHDTVCMEKTGDSVEVVCDSDKVPQGSGNIAFKAAALIMDRFSLKGGLKISIAKRIPVAAGLAGGSADAAAVLKGVNELYSLGLDTEELCTLGRQVGADVPYCIKGGTMLAEGIGEKLTPLGQFKDVDVVLVKPKIGVSTAWVYGNLDLAAIKPEGRPDTDLLLRAVSNGDIAGIAADMKNVLEYVTIPRHPVVAEAKGRLAGSGALGSMMSGSGPSVFGLFADLRKAQAAYGKLLGDRRWDCYLTQTI